MSPVRESTERPAVRPREKGMMPEMAVERRSGRWRPSGGERLTAGATEFAGRMDGARKERSKGREAQGEMRSFDWSTMAPVKEEEMANAEEERPVKRRVAGVAQGSKRRGARWLPFDLYVDLASIVRSKQEYNQALQAMAKRRNLGWEEIMGGRLQASVQGGDARGPGVVVGGRDVRGDGGGLAGAGSDMSFEDLELGIADEDGIAAADGLEAVKVVAKLRDVGKEVTLDDLLNRGHVGILVEDGGVALPRVSRRLGGGDQGRENGQEKADNSDFLGLPLFFVLFLF